MACSHHQDYRPENGEPEGIIELANLHKQPCPYCWQARAKWLDEEHTSYVVTALATVLGQKEREIALRKALLLYGCPRHEIERIAGEDKVNPVSKPSDSKAPNPEQQ